MHGAGADAHGVGTAGRRVRGVSQRGGSQRKEGGREGGWRGGREGEGEAHKLGPRRQPRRGADCVRLACEGA